MLTLPSTISYDIISLPIVSAYPTACHSAGDHAQFTYSLGCDRAWLPLLRISRAAPLKDDVARAEAAARVSCLMLPLSARLPFDIVVRGLG